MIIAALRNYYSQTSEKTVVENDAFLNSKAFFKKKTFLHFPLFLNSVLCTKPSKFVQPLKLGVNICSCLKVF